MMKTAPKASWLQRAGATLIDALILTGVALLVGIVMSIAGASGDDATIAIYVAVFLASATYGPVLMAREGDKNGQTIGKTALNIRVVHAEGTPMTLQRGLLRDGVGKALLGIVPLYTIVDVLVPLVDKDNQALHDKIGSTYVVDAKQVPVMSYRSDDAARDSFGAVAGGGGGGAHESWSAPSQPVPARPSPPAPPRDRVPSPTPVPPEQAPDLGGFAPPTPPTPPAKPADREDEEPRGPFGPSHD